MPAASPTTQRVRELLAQRGLTMNDLSKSIGKSITTLPNVLTGQTNQRPTRQKISDFLGARLWDDITPRPIGIRLPLGTRIQLPSSGSADALQCVLGSVVSRSENELRFTVPALIRISAPTADTAHKPHEK
jgi:transcriptional regulator with XRE-family HTH domain